MGIGQRHLMGCGRYGACEVVGPVGQRHIACACAQAAGSRHRQGPALGDLTIAAVGDQVAAHGTRAQVQGPRAIDRQVTRGGDRAQRECMGVSDGYILPATAVCTDERNNSLEVVACVTQQRTLASSGIGYEACRAADTDGAALTHATQSTHPPAGTAQVPTDACRPEVDRASAR